MTDVFNAEDARIALRYVDEFVAQDDLDDTTARAKSGSIYDQHRRAVFVYCLRRVPSKTPSTPSTRPSP